MNNKKILAAILTCFAVVPAAAYAKTFNLTIINNTKTVIESVYASPKGVKNWEEDLLGDRAINAGGRFKVSFEDDRKVCNYDLRFEFRSKEYEPMEDTQNLCKITEYEVTE